MGRDLLKYHTYMYPGVTTARHWVASVYPGVKTARHWVASLHGTRAPLNLTLTRFKNDFRNHYPNPNLPLTLMLTRFRNTNLLKELYVPRLYLRAHTQTYRLSLYAAHVHVHVCI